MGRDAGTLGIFWGFIINSHESRSTMVRNFCEEEAACISIIAILLQENSCKYSFHEFLNVKNFNISQNSRNKILSMMICLSEFASTIQCKIDS